MKKNNILDLNLSFILSILLLLTINNIQSQTLYNGVGHIPSYFQVPWTEAGLLQDVSTITPVAVFVVEGTATDDDTEWATALSDARNHVLLAGDL